MTSKKLVHQSQLDHDGQSYQVFVYEGANGRHFAETPLGIDDIVINDGISLEAVLEKHSNLLPLAINARKIRRKSIGKGW